MVQQDPHNNEYKAEAPPHMTTQSSDNEKLISDLYQIIENEVVKPTDQIDYDLVMECSNFIEEITSNQVWHTSEELQTRLETFLKNITSLNQNSANNTPELIYTHKSKRRRNRLWFKVVSSIAAVFIVVFCAISMVAASEGYDSTWAFITSHIEVILNMNPGDTLAENSVEIVKHSGTHTYPSIKELLRAEGYSVFYPSILPNDIIIKKVIQNDEEKGKTTLVFLTNSDDFSFSICNYLQKPQESWKNYETLETDSMTFFVSALPEGMYQAVAQKGGYEYYIVYNNYDELLNILNSMTEIQK